MCAYVRAFVRSRTNRILSSIDVVYNMVRARKNARGKEDREREKNRRWLTYVPRYNLTGDHGEKTRTTFVSRARFMTHRNSIARRKSRALSDTVEENLRAMRTQHIITNTYQTNGVLRSKLSFNFTGFPPVRFRARLLRNCYHRWLKTNDCVVEPCNKVLTGILKVKVKRARARSLSFL